MGAGNSTNRKDAEKNAARDYISFLVRSGKIRPNEVPGDATDGVIAATAGPADIPSLMSQNTAAPVFSVSSRSNSSEVQTFNCIVMRRADLAHKIWARLIVLIMRVANNVILDHKVTWIVSTRR